MWAAGGMAAAANFGAAVYKPFVMLSSSQLQLLCLLAWMQLLAWLLLAAAIYVEPAACNTVASLTAAFLAAVTVPDHGGGRRK